EGGGGGEGGGVQRGEGGGGGAPARGAAVRAAPAAARPPRRGGRLPAVLDGLPRLRADAGRGRRRRGLARPGHEDAVALMRYFLVDKVTELVPGERIRGVKCVSLSDEVLHDHFPDFPVMPGALIVEAGAQLAGFL